MRKIYLLIILVGVILISCEKENSQPNHEIEYPNIVVLKSPRYWSISSVPEQFPESSFNNDLMSGYNRAKIAWYKIDPLFLRNNSLTPGHIAADIEQQSNHFVREIFEHEIFPETESETVIPVTIPVLNIAFYPEERGPYNFDSYSTDYSAGLNSTGKLNSPETRWAGIQREIPVTGKLFDTLEFWLMDPFVYNENISGDLYINLGDISEDVLKDSKMNTEEGFYNIDWDTTAWGIVPLGGTSDNISDGLADYGIDRLSDYNERFFFNNYLSNIYNLCNSEVYNLILEDPSNDNYHYYKGQDYDALQLSILERYKKYNEVEGNSSGEASQPATRIPDTEDIDGNFILNTTNNYEEYKISIRNSDFVEGNNYLVEKRLGYNVNLPNGEQDVEIAWYNFKIPLGQRSNSYVQFGSIVNPEFIRIYLTNFEEEVILRFAKLELSYPKN
ncbi:cell surface protein SprA [Bacteroidota bacterium]